MAYQIGLPLLILKEKKLYSEGILDPNNSESYIFNFEIEKNSDQLSSDLVQIIKSWANKLS